MYCSNCKREVEDGSIFCIYCGCKIIPDFQMNTQNNIQIELANEVKDVNTNFKDVDHLVNSNEKINEDINEIIDKEISEDTISETFDEESVINKEELFKSSEYAGINNEISKEVTDDCIDVNEDKEPSNKLDKKDVSTDIITDKNNVIEEHNNSAFEEEVLITDDNEFNNVESDNNLISEGELNTVSSSNEEDKSNIVINDNFYEKNKDDNTLIKKSDNNNRNKNNKKIMIAVSSAVLLIVAIIVASVIINKINTKKICGFINDYVSKYNEDQIDYEAAKTAISEINTKNNEEIILCQKNALTQLDRIKNNKDNYEKAKNDLSNGNFDKAIDSLEEIPKDDYNYQEAQELLTTAQQNYLDDVNNSIKKYLENNDFDSANNVVDKAIKVIPSQKDNLEKKKAEIEDAKNAYVKKQINDLENSAKTNKEKEDYLSAIKDYKKLYEMTKDEAYKGSISNAEIEWENASIKAAESKLSEGQVEEALNCLREAQSNIQDKTVLNKEEQRILGYRPVLLEDKTVMAYGKEPNGLHTMKWDENIIDNTGNYSGKGMIIRDIITYGPNQYVKYWAKYSLDDDYDYLSCRFAIPGDDNYYLNTKTDLYLKVYCNDTLVYTSQPLTGGSIPLDLNNIEITGAKTLTLELYAINNTEKQISDHTSVGWCDAKLYKKYTPLE